jgi:carbon monoxide dehydrogenase subunit G
MEFDNTFTVAAPIDEVWAAILDLERVAPCVPGAQVLEQTGDNAYKVAIKVKLGPMSMTYRGDVEIVEHDDAEHRAKMNAKAKETRGQGTANAGVEMRLAEVNGATTGTIHSDVAISGKAASMGQGVIADVSGRLVDTFAANLAAMLAGPAAEEPAAAATPGATPPPPGVASPAADEGLPILAIVGKVLAQRLRDPRIAVPALVALVLLLRALRRRG